jgi:hypothetical protein
MSQPDNHDLERRLRDAFAARAEQIQQHDLDVDREVDLAERLRAPSGPSRTRKIFAGAGILAAAAAVAGVIALAIQPSGQRPSNALRPATTASVTRTVGPGPTIATTPTSSPSRATPHVVQPPAQLSTTTPPPATSTTSTATPTVPTTPTTHRAATTTARNQTSTSSSPTSSTTTNVPLPPAMPPGLPQSGSLGAGEYTGPVPLADTGHGTRMLSMPEGTKWQVTSQADGSMTIRLTYLSTDIDAYWRATLPAQGWRPDAQFETSGWSFPGTMYAVSAITDKGSFTVTW